MQSCTVYIVQLYVIANAIFVILYGTCFICYFFSHSPQTYDLFANNCNNFSNEVAQFLTGQSIPDNIVNLPSEVLET